MLPRSGPISTSFASRLSSSRGKISPHFQNLDASQLESVQRDRSAELRSGFHMACCCSSHKSNVTCDVIHSQGSRLPMELRRWSIPCSFHVSQVKTAPVLTSYKNPPHSPRLRIFVFPHNSCLCSTSRSKQKNLIPNYSKTLLLHSIFSMSYGGDDNSYGVR
jgi:hypothetical protein